MQVAWLARRDVTGPTGGPHRRALQAAGLGLSNEAWADNSATLGKAKLAKAAWLARRDAPVWASATSPPPRAAATAAPELVEAAGPSMPSEDEAKREWLAKQEEPAWGRGGAAAAPEDSAYVTPVPAAAPMAEAEASSEAAAKAAWLAKRGAPAWGAAAKEGYSRDTQRRLGL